jgi:integrase/recombinase XerC
MSQVLPFRVPERAAPPAVGRIDLYGALLADARKPDTRRARVQDFADLARFLGLDEPEAAAALLVASDAGSANALGLAYRRHLQERKLSAATINRRLSTIRRAVTLARRFGLIGWAVDLDGLPARPYRDTAGPGEEGMAALFDMARAAATTPKGKRDWALVALFYSAGLRRSEGAALDVVDLDLEGCKVRVVGKGTSEPRWLPMSRVAAAALGGWLAVRPGSTPALFVRLDDAAARPARMTADGIHHVLAAMGRAAGLARPLSPHQIRHAAITRLAKRTGGNMPLIQEFSRHAKVETVGVYIRNARDAAAGLAELLGEDLAEGPPGAAGAGSR